MNLREKIWLLMKKQDITRADLSNQTGLPYTTIDSILKRDKFEKVKLATLKTLADYFDVSLDYLLNDDIDDENYGKNCAIRLSKDEMTIIKKYRSLDENGKQFIKIAVDHEISRCAIEGREDRSAIYLKVFSQPISAGKGIHLFDQDDADVVEMEFPDTPTTRRADFALRVVGDSMEPKYHDGDIILIERTDNVDIGEIGIFIVDGEGYFKKLERGRLVSLNSKYKDIPLYDYNDVRYVGRVIGSM